MQDVVILHLSDLHFDSRELSVEQPTKFAIRKLQLDKLQQTLANLNNQWTPDIIAVTGDISWAGKKEDFELAEHWFADLLKILKLPKDRLVLCPGNHDLDRDKISMKYPETFQEADNQLKIESMNKFNPLYENYINFNKHMGIPPLNIAGKENYLVGERRFKGIRFISLNSSWYAYEGNMMGKLWLGLPQLQVLEANNQICSIINYDSCPITICLLHHPQSYLNEYEMESYKNREPTFRYLANRVHIILSGHLHGEIISKPDRISNKAYSYRAGASYKGPYSTNNFSLIKINQSKREIQHKSFISSPTEARLIEYGTLRTYSLESAARPKIGKEELLQINFEEIPEDRDKKINFELNNIYLGLPHEVDTRRLEHKSDFNWMNPQYWDSSGMKFDNDQRIWYGKIPGTDIYTATRGTGFYVDYPYLNDDRVNDFFNKVALQTDINTLISKNPDNKFKFDYAFSYAGEDREIARKIAEELAKQGVKVFFDDFYNTELVGKDLSVYFGEVYGIGTRFVVIFLSKHYILKDWTNFEFEIARDEAGRRNKEFIIPIRLDDTIFHGLKRTIAYIPYKENDLGKIVEILLKKLKSSNI